jgi:hypothetical protein
LSSNRFQSRRDWTPSSDTRGRCVANILTNGMRVFSKCGFLTNAERTFATCAAPLNDDVTAHDLPPRSSPFLLTTDTQFDRLWFDVDQSDAFKATNALPAGHELVRQVQQRGKSHHYDASNTGTTPRGLVVVSGGHGSIADKLHCRASQQWQARSPEGE